MSQPKKIAIVTGASRGIGQAIATELAKKGHQVIGTTRSEDTAEKMTKNYSDEGLSITGVALQLEHRAARDQFMSMILERYGQVDVLVNNAGITEDNLTLRMQSSQWESVLEVNLTAVFHLTQLALKAMIRARSGRVIQVGSVVGHTGNPGQANYCAAKAGLVGMSKSMAYEAAARGITINVVSPGFIETDMTAKLNEKQQEAILQKIPLKRMGSAMDIASAVGFLASAQASYITGQTLHVNGGMYMA